MKTEKVTEEVSVCGCCLHSRHWVRLAGTEDVKRCDWGFDARHHETRDLAGRVEATTNDRRSMPFQPFTFRVVWRHLNVLREKEQS